MGQNRGKSTTRKSPSYNWEENLQFSLSTAPPNTMLLSTAWNVLGAQAGLSRPVVAICKAVSQVLLGVSGDFWGSQEGCQGPFRPSGRNRGLPLWACPGQDTQDG